MPRLSDIVGQVRLLASEARIGQVGGDLAVPTGGFDRPKDATTYAAGDLVANSASREHVAPIELPTARKIGGNGRITRARLRKSSSSILGASFRIHVFRLVPSVGEGDNAPLSITGVAGYVGAIDVTMDQVFTDGAMGFGVPNTGAFIACGADPKSINLYALLEARSAYAPEAGETFTLALEVDRD